MDLKEYDTRLQIEANGLRNTGVICYFNSLIQSLLSCTSFIQTILDVGYSQNMDKPTGHNKGSLASNELWQVLFYICSKLKSNPSDWSSTYSIAIYKMFMKEIKKQNKQTNLGNGQEDAQEALLLFLDCLETKTHNDVSKLFQHRYRCFITCPECHNIHEMNNLTGSIRIFSYIDEQDSKNHTLNNFIRSHNGETDDKHICTNCDFKGIKKIRYVLTMLPEIFIVLFKKYNKKWISNRPESLSFVTNTKYNNKNMNYMLVSQIEHTGNRDGGHYWCRSLRQDGIYVLNDMNITEEKHWQSGEPNIYIAFYHYTGLS